MTTTLKIKDKYADNTELKDLLTNIESRFDNEGETIFQNRRNTLKSFCIDGMGKIVIKRFKPKNIFQTIFYTLAGTSKAKKAYENGIELEKAKIGTPEAIAYAETRNGLTLKQCYVATSFTSDNAISDLIDKEIDHNLTRELGKMLAKMHENGIVHHDMNRTNILYQKTENGYDLSLIDINRLKKRKKVDFTEYSDDFVRLTDRMDWIVDIAYAYARERGMAPDAFVMRIANAKYEHNRKEYRKRRFKSLFK